jgi:CRP/FNR family transcriptional regulator, cyclic AMP receptor protein
VSAAARGYDLVMAAATAKVLVRDPDLAAGLAGDRLRNAERDLVAATVVAFEGPWDAEAEGEPARGGIGLLVLEGLIVRRVGRTGRYGAELLGPGDLMRPWQDDGEDVSLPFDTTFRVIEQSMLAVLDFRFAARAAPYPEVAGALVGRAMQRSRALVVAMAIAHYPRIDRRLLMLLWHLADRWGRVTPDGIRISMRLTHQLLADLVASRRPSVTTGLQQLTHDGLISRIGDAWILHGEPPSELYAVERAANEH